MYSQSFIIEISNPGDQPEEYLLNYNGNDTEEDIEKKIFLIINKNGYFNRQEFCTENQGYELICLADLDIVKILVSKNTWDIGNLKVKEILR